MNGTISRKERSKKRFMTTLLLASLVFMVLILTTNGAATTGYEGEVTNVTVSAQTESTVASTGVVELEEKFTYTEKVTDATLPQEIAETEPVYEKLYTEKDVIALAKMAWGEALGTGSDTEIAATMWCALNRFDSDDPYYQDCKTIEAIVKQSGAFAGYSSRNPEDEHLMWLAQDVLDRWNAEQHGETDVGRVLPADYLFFHGDGRHNHFRKEYRFNGQYWDWSLDSPYET